MNQQTTDSESSGVPQNAGPDATQGGRAQKTKPVRALPTDRVGFERQLRVLLAYAAASGPERRPVSARDVAPFAELHEGSISICNPFFHESGLIIREGAKYIPSDELVNYYSAHEWDSGSAAQKLAPALQKSWFGDLLLRRLSVRPYSRDEAVGALAMEARASKDYQPQIELLLEFLRAANLIVVEGNLVTAVKRSANHAPAPVEVVATRNQEGTRPELPPEPDAGVERFNIPIPGKTSATITVPKDLTPDDWTMLKTMLEAYIARLQSQQGQR